MKVYVLNLDRCPERLAHMRDQLRAMEFERIAAIDGSQHPPTPSGPTRLELACLQSHRMVWRRFLLGNDSCACVLEDDLHLAPDFAALIGDCSWLPAEAHIVKLDTYLQTVMLGRDRRPAGERRLAHLYSLHESSAAYVITREGAERYLELTASTRLPVDHVIFPARPRRQGLRIYQLVPAVAIQDHLLPPRDPSCGFATAIVDRFGREARNSGGPFQWTKIKRETARVVDNTATLVETLVLKAAFNAETTKVESR